MKFFRQGTLLLMMAALSTSALHANVKKGQKYYQKKLQKSCNKNGGEFASLHSQSEWKKSLDNGTFKTLILDACPAGKSFVDDAKFDDKYQEHLYDFFFEYANDSGNVPSC